MPIRGSKNVKQKNIEFPPDTLDRFEEFRAQRGVHPTFKGELVEAMERHMRYPPATLPPPVPRPLSPLGDSPAVDEPPAAPKSKAAASKPAAEKPAKGKKRKG